VQKFWRSKYSSILRVINRTSRARNEVDKVLMVGGSNNAGHWRRSSQPPEANGGSGAEPPTQRQCFTFFKKYAFLSVLWSKYFGLNFCLKCVFKWLQKVCWCAPKACAPGRMPPLALPLLLLFVCFYFLLFVKIPRLGDSKGIFSASTVSCHVLISDAKRVERIPLPTLAQRNNKKTC